MSDLEISDLYEQHWPAIYGFLRNRMPYSDPADVEDLTALVFERVVRSSATYVEYGTPGRWLQQIARNLLIDHWRHLAVSPVSVELSDDRMRERAAVDAGSMAQVDQIDVAALLNRLPPKQKVALVDRYWIGARTEDTARLMGVTEDAIKHLRQRALQRLAKMMEAA